jgi:hypothetical protein
MTGIARFVDDPKIKQLLLETDGIGTPATQAKIIDTLLERRFIEKRGRHVVDAGSPSARPDPARGCNPTRHDRSLGGGDAQDRGRCDVARPLSRRSHRPAPEAG